MSANDVQHGGSHYKVPGGGLEHWDIIVRNNVGYLEGCATKYVCRWRQKGGILDLQKAAHFVDKLVELTCELGHGRLPSGSAPLDQIMHLTDVHGLSPTEDTVVTLLLTWRTVADLMTARRAIDRLVANEQHRLQNSEKTHDQGRTAGSVEGSS